MQILNIIFEIDSVLRKALKAKESLSRGNHNEGFPSLTINLKASVKRPSLNIKYFSGNPLKFQSFLDNFNAAIHENDKIPPIPQLFEIFLKGSTAGCISDLNFIADYYKQALETRATLWQATSNSNTF